MMITALISPEHIFVPSKSLIVDRFLIQNDSISLKLWIRFRYFSNTPFFGHKIFQTIVIQFLEKQFQFNITNVELTSEYIKISVLEENIFYYRCKYDENKIYFYHIEIVNESIKSIQQI